jgi:pimeloyl-ACP methyl ester carboxylesterase
MKPETEFFPSSDNKPLVVFIHGMGMDVTLWSNPSEARVLGGKYPLSALLKTAGADLRTSFTDARERGYSVVSWSQSRPVGHIATAIAELTELLKKYRDFSQKGIILIGHSRGGLIARKYLEIEGLRNIKALITITSPHHGSTMAQWAAYVSPLASVLTAMLGGGRRREIKSALERILVFLCSDGLKELLPGSPFIRALKDKKHGNAPCISIGGTHPDIIFFEGISIPHLISKVFPEKLIPDEMREGYGDGLVSAESSVLPYADEHRDFALSHLSILFDKAVRMFIAERIEALS